MRIFKADKAQELFDKARERRFRTIGSPSEEFGQRVFAQTEEQMSFMFNNGKIIIKQTVRKSGDDVRDQLELYQGLCEFLLDAINELEHE